MNHKSIYPFFPSELFAQNFGDSVNEVERKERELSINRTASSINDLRDCYKKALRKGYDINNLKQRVVSANDVINLAIEDLQHFQMSINSIYSNVSTYIGSLFTILFFLFGGGIIFGAESSKIAFNFIPFCVVIVFVGLLFYCLNHKFIEHAVHLRMYYRNTIICFQAFDDCLTELSSETTHKR